MGFSGALSRRLKVFMVALTIFLDYKAIQKRERWVRKQKREAMWERAHERNAKRVLKTITELEGLWVKAGQYLSTRADVLPGAYIRLLRQLQDSLPPRPLSEVYQTIEEGLGKSPNELFMEFDNVPMATASIAQVHRACTKDGVDVVVKVQHRGIKECILQDLQNARTIVRWIAWAEPQYDFGPVLDEWCAEVPKELDFDLEADNTRKVAHNLDSKDDQREQSTLENVDVLLPKIVQSSEKVLLLTYMDGIRVSDVEALDKFGVNTQALVEAITRAYAHQIYVDGFFNADPHPGNFLVSKEPPFRPILLDFGLTKSLTIPTKQALAKMLLACAEGDYAALLSAFAEMGLKLHLDMPEEAMQITSFFFRRTTPAKESLDDTKTWIKEREQRMKHIQERMQEENDKKSLNRSPVDAFPGEVVFFMRVLNLLRGLSSMLGARVAYLELMRPYAESVLWSGNILKVGRQLQSYQWIHSNPALSEVERKLQSLLLTMGQNQQILGIQVCAYKDGKVIIDTAAGVLGRYDPRPVQPDSLFPVFSVTKGVTAALVHWLADHRKLGLEDNVSTHWPEFAANGKASCTVANVLNHTAGLQNALQEALMENPLITCDWNKMLQEIATATPQSTPGSDQKYHALAFGWLCGGIIEKAGGKNFQDLLEEVLVNPLGVTGEFYIGIPPGVESRLASLTLSEELRSLAASPQIVATLSQAIQNAGEQDGPAPRLTGVLNPETFSAISTMPSVFNTLFIRRAIIPSANGHFSARALARFYAMLGSGGIVPSPQSTSQPPLGSHPHYPSTSNKVKSSKKPNPKKSNTKLQEYRSEVSSKDSQIIPERKLDKLFQNPNIHDAFLGIGTYKHLTVPDGPFGLGFQRFANQNELHDHGFYTFGHSGVGGSLGYCDPSNAFSIAVTVNQMALGQVTREIVQFVCSEIGIQCPSQFHSSGLTALEDL